MLKQLIRAVKNSKLGKAILFRCENRIELNEINGEEHPWQRDLDHLARKLGEEEVSIQKVQDDATKVAESTMVEKDFQNLFNEVKSEMQQKQSGTKSPVVTKKTTREGDITAVDLKSWWGQSVATWDPIDSKNVDSVNQQPRKQRTKWFDGY